MENPAVDQAVEAFEAAATAFVACVRRALGCQGSASADPLREQADACLDGLAESATIDAMVAAFRVRLAAGFADKAVAMDAPAKSPGEHTAQERAIVSEVACVLTVSERSAGALLGQSHELTAALPLTLAALQAGSISWQHARIMVDETTSLDPAGAASMEAHFLAPEEPDRAQQCPAGDLAPSRFRHKARTWRERHHTVSIEKRHAKSLLDRRLEYIPDRDGMAWLSTYLPADQAGGIWNGITAAARAHQGPDESRTITQIRADIAATLLLSASGDLSATPSAHDSPDSGADRVRADGAPTGGTVVSAGLARVPSPSAQVLVTVPVFALMGLTDEPALLDGYGPIPASMARSLVADGASSFHRVLTDPRNGAPLEIGRSSYPVTAAIRRWLRLRDGKCPFPGCSNQSLDNEADHLLAWADGGTTGISNLGQPCPKHHRLKHTSGWTPGPATKDHPPGWISPSGRQYKSEHQDWEPPQWPPQLRDLLSDQGLSAAVPEDALLGEIVPEEIPSEETPNGEILPEDLPVDPLPEWVWRSWPVDEPDPDPEDCPPGDTYVPNGHLPGWHLPGDPYPEWAEFLTHEEHITA